MEKNVAKEIVVVFKDAAEYEASVVRNQAFKNMTQVPYVVICDENTYGPVEGAVLAPEDIKQKILSKYPLSYSTWIFSQGDWYNVSNQETKSTELFDEIFKANFLSRIDQLVLIFTALGIKKISVDAYEKRIQGSDNDTKSATKGKVNVSIPTKEVSTEGCESHSWSERSDFFQEIQVHIKKEFSKADKFDEKKVKDLMEECGLLGDMKLNALLKEQDYGREKSKLNEYSFSGKFVTEFEHKLSSAARLAANVKIANVGGSVDVSNDFKSRCKYWETMVQQLHIKLEN